MYVYAMEWYKGAADAGEETACFAWEYWYFCSLICIKVWLFMRSVIRSTASANCFSVIHGFRAFCALQK